MPDHAPSSTHPATGGFVRIAGEGSTPAEALTAALTQLLPHLQHGVGGTGSGRSVTIRAEVDSLDELLPALALHLLDAIDSHGRAIAAIEVSGVVRSTNGLIGWATAELAKEHAPHAEPALIVDLAVRDEPGSVTIEATLVPSLIGL